MHFQYAILQYNRNNLHETLFFRNEKKTEKNQQKPSIICTHIYFYNFIYFDFFFWQKFEIVIETTCINYFRTGPWTQIFSFVTYILYRIEKSNFVKDQNNYNIKKLYNITRKTIK